MSNRMIITYAYDTETGVVISRVGSQVAIPVLQYADMKPENNFQTNYELEKISVFAIASYWDNYKWTKKVPVNVKNQHRKFWGMKELKK